MLILEEGFRWHLQAFATELFISRFLDVLLVGAWPNGGGVAKAYVCFVLI